jgi:signal recognition particle GTPase
MAWAIERGRFRPVSPQFYRADISQFKSSAIKATVHQSPKLFCALIGVKGTGKTTELKKFASEQKNAVF